MWNLFARGGALGALRDAGAKRPDELGVQVLMRRVRLDRSFLDEDEPRNRVATGFVFQLGDRLALGVGFDLGLPSIAQPDDADVEVAAANVVDARLDNGTTSARRVISTVPCCEAIRDAISRSTARSSTVDEM